MSDSDEFIQAQEYFENEEYEKAIKIYSQLANSGSVDSQVFLGWMYQNGLGVKRDESVAFSWYENAAKLGSAEGQFYLAKCYMKRKEYPKAKDWLLKSATNNYAPALFRLGWLYEVGRGVDLNRDKAYSFYKRAADLGHAFAQKQLGVLLLKGQHGLIGRLTGLVLVIKSIATVVLIGIKDPHSEMLRE